MTDKDETNYDEIFPAAVKNEGTISIDQRHYDRNEELSRVEGNDNFEEPNNNNRG